MLLVMGLYETLLVGRTPRDPDKDEKKRDEYRKDFSSHTILPF
jgi:hypothetical protein